MTLAREWVQALRRTASAPLPPAVARAAALHFTDALGWGWPLRPHAPALAGGRLAAPWLRVVMPRFWGKPQGPVPPTRRWSMAA